MPNGVDVMSVRWIFAGKVDKYGSVMKLKARFLAKGFSQVHTKIFSNAMLLLRLSPVLKHWWLFEDGYSQIGNNMYVG